MCADDFQGTTPVYSRVCDGINTAGIEAQRELIQDNITALSSEYIGV